MGQLEYFRQAIGTISIEPYISAIWDVYHSTNTTVTVSGSALGCPSTPPGYYVTTIIQVEAM
jgi:hypothetical protein